jgi:hypothetical protein
MEVQAEITLPPAFKELERFRAYWDVRTSNERWARRSEASMEDIVDFYDTIFPIADDVLAYVEQYPLDDLPEDAASLLRLLLAMTQAAMAVEVHGQPRVPHSPYPHDIRLTSGMAPFG